MLDRASTFADDEIVSMLKTKFVPAAIDQAYQRRQKDTEGDFYRKIAGQGPRNNFNGTTQGFYIATPAGKLLLYNNNRDPAKVRRLMKQKLAIYRRSAEIKGKVPALRRTKIDPRWNAKPPAGGLVLRVRAKILSGYAKPKGEWDAIFQKALSRDNLWMTKAEHKEIAAGKIPRIVQQRLARFHLVDNTRGEPPMWSTRDIKHIEMKLVGGKLTGRVHLETARGDRGYKADLRGEVSVKNGKVVRFDLVALGDFWGEGRWTRNAPKGKFPLAVAFSLADGTDVADAIPPQGSRGWVPGYLQTRR